MKIFAPSNCIHALYMDHIKEQIIEIVKAPMIEKSLELLDPL